MSYSPRTIVDLSRFWVNQGGTPLGIVGNAVHCTGYHLGKDRIFGDCACRPEGVCVPGKRSYDYSVQYQRDKNGLTNAASAIDLGRLNGSLTQLYRFSAWLVKRCMADPVARKDIREIIYWSVANGRVNRYSGQDNKIHWGPGNGDSSHKTHTHISFWRDSEYRDKIALFAPYFAPLPPDTATETDMPNLTSYIPGQVATLKAMSYVRSAPQLAASTALRYVPQGQTEDWVVTGWLKGEIDPESGSNLWLCRWAGTRWEYTAKANIIKGPSPVTADCSVVEGELAKANQEIDGLRAALRGSETQIETLQVELAGEPLRTQAAIEADRAKATIVVPPPHISWSGS